jgi:hypothetical protein
MTAAARQERLATEKLTPRQVKDLETELALIQKEIADVEAAIADPALRSLYEEGVVGLPVRPTKEGVPDPIAGHQYYYSPHTGRWELRRTAGYKGPRFDVEYVDGQPTGLLTNKVQIEKQLQNRVLNDDTWKVLEQYGYSEGPGGQILRPKGFAGEGKYLTPLEVVDGRIKVAAADPDIDVIRGIRRDETALAAARKEYWKLKNANKPTAKAEAKVKEAAEALALSRLKAPPDAYRTIDLSPEEFMRDKAAQRKLFEEAQGVQQRQQALADQTLAELGLPPGKAYSILKRPEESEFVEGIVKKTTERKPYSRVGDMPDIVRGRFNLDSLDDVEKVAAKLSDHPDVVEIVKPRAREGVEMGYPRYHVVLKDPQTGILHEWQIGTEATTRVFEGKKGVIPEIDIPKGLKLKEGMHANIHDIEYDIFKAIQDSTKPADKALAKKLKIPEFRKKVAELAAESGTRGGPAHLYDERIAELHKEASIILAGIVRMRGPGFVTRLFH